MSPILVRATCSAMRPERLRRVSSTLVMLESRFDSELERVSHELKTLSNERKTKSF